MPIVPVDAFAEIAREVAAAAKERGFRRKALVFRKGFEEIFGAFSVDRSKWNRADDIEFRFSIDAVHVSLHEIYSWEPFREKDCRPGYGVAAQTIRRDSYCRGADFPWRLDRDTNLDALRTDVHDALETDVFPRIEAMSSNKGLCEALWELYEQRKGAVYLSQRICLICLLHERDQEERLDRIMRATLARLSDPKKQSHLVSFVAKLARVGIDAERFQP